MTEIDWQNVFLHDSSDEALAAFCDWMEEHGDVDPGHLHGLRGLAGLADAVAATRKTVHDPDRFPVTTVDIHANGEFRVGKPGFVWAIGEYSECVCGSLTVLYLYRMAGTLDMPQALILWWHRRLGIRFDSIDQDGYHIARFHFLDA